MSKNQTEPIYIVCATDDNYAQHCGVMLSSLIQNHTCEGPLEVYILTSTLSEENKEKLSGLTCKNDVSIRFIYVNSSNFNNFKISHYVSEATYYRLVIPEVLSKNIEKIIYLDCDLIVLDEIKSIWDLDVSDYALAAAKDLDVESDHPKHLQNLNIPAGKYFNAGVMVINLKYWRDHDVPIKARSFLTANNDKVILWDQDALNVLLHEQWKRIDDKWNCLPHFTYKDSIEALSKDPKEYSANVSIMHLSGPKKPWHFFSIDPRRQYYFEYLSKSPWKYLENPDKNIIKIIFISFLRIIPKFLIRFLYTLLHLIGIG